MVRPNSRLKNTKRKIINMKFQPPKGTRDFLPDEAEKLQRMVDVVRSIFEKYGFQPLFTPAFESFDLLSAKGGLGEAVKDEIYYFKDKSDRELGLRFDLTMPLARVVVSNPQLQKPVKRYIIDRVWRYDNPQKLRYREFWQADIDVVGSKSLLADAECLACICEILDELRFDYKIKVNNRKLLQDYIKNFVEKEKVFIAMRILDKIDRIGLKGIMEEFKKEGLNELASRVVWSDWDYSRNRNLTNEMFIKKFKNYDKSGSIDEFKELLNYAKSFGFGNKINLDITLARGLDYYTGLIFEIIIKGVENISVGGGGRYDNLIKNISGFDVPATGISLGLSRLFELMKETDKKKNGVFIASVSSDVMSEVVEIAQKLRENNITCSMDLMNRSLSKQLEYANNINVPYVLIIGPEEIKKKKFKLKDMEKKTERELTLEEIIKMLKTGNSR